MISDIVKLIRREGRYTDGRWEQVKETTVEIPAHVQPASPLEVELLPEGKRGRAAIRLFSAEDLSPGLEGTARNGDIVEFRGRRWEVAAVEDFSHYGLAADHWEALAVLVDDA